jgi:hypothetical protein
LSMLSLLKKKSEASAAPAVPPWHPNFRNYEKLPDIKVVRTAFFINGIAITITIGLAGYFGFNEWNLRVLNGQIADQQRVITANKPASDKAVAEFNKFKAEEAKINEVDTFLKSKPVVSDLLMHLGRILPPEIALDNVALRDNGMTLRVSVRGTPEAASGTTAAFIDQLRADQELLKLFGPASIANLAPNPGTGRLAVELTLPIKPAKK